MKRNVMNKREFFENGSVMSFAGEMESCLKICFSIYIRWETLVGYLWKRKGLRIAFINGINWKAKDVYNACKQLKEDFNEYFVVKLK